MRDYLIVVDMQVDFVSGVLGTPEAQKIVPTVVRRVEAAAERGERVIFTRDTHQSDYMETQEGRKLPVPHCIEGSDGWQLIEELIPLAADCPVFDKPTFGSTALAEYLREKNTGEGVGKITLIGVCTDICVISNALLLKAGLPECEIYVDAACCAGVTPDSHETALRAMTACQITVENGE